MRLKFFKLILLFLLFQTNCNEVEKKNEIPFLSYLSRFRTLSSSSTNPSTISNYTNNFHSSETLASILIPKDKVLEFNFEVEISSCEIFLGTVKQNFVTVESNSTVTKFIPSSAGWTLEVETPLALTFQNCISKTGSALTTTDPKINLYVAEKVVYVDSVSGVDTNSGTTEAPMKTILAALNSASSGCVDRCAIGIKGGTYPINSSITMPTNISIFGGFHSTDWTKRRADKTMLSPYDSILNDISSTVSGVAINPYSTLKFSSYTGEYSKTIIDGIIVNGATTPTTSTELAVISSINLQTGSGFIIRNSTLNDRTISGTTITTFCFFSYNPSGKILIENNSLINNSSYLSPKKVGVKLQGTNAGSESILKNNSIQVGNTNNSAGIFGIETFGANQGRFEFVKNSISTNAGATDILNEGIRLVSNLANSVLISENNINIGNGTDVYGINSLNSIEAIIEKNIITTGNGSTGGSSKGITTNSTTSNIMIRDNTITSGLGGTNGSNPIVLYEHSGLATITGNQFNSGNCNALNCSSAAVFLSTTLTNTLLLKNNIIKGGTCTGINCISIGVFSNSTGTSNYDISENTIINESSSGTNSSNYGIQFSSASSATINLSNNTITSGSAITESAGVRITYNNATPVTVTGNTIRSGNAATTWGIYNTSGSNYTVQNNTIIGGACTGVSCNQFGYEHGAITNLSLIGNTIQTANNTNTNTTSRIALRINNYATGTLIKRNTFFVGQGHGINRAVLFDGPTRTGDYKFCSNVVIGGNNLNSSASNTMEIPELSNINNKIMGNTFIGGTTVGGASKIFVMTGSGVKHDLDQNLFVGNSVASVSTTCIHESAASISYVNLRRNHFQNCDTVYNRNGTQFNDICTGELKQASCGTSIINPSSSNNTKAPTDLAVFENPSGLNYKLAAGTSTTVSIGMDGTALGDFNTSCGDFLDRNGEVRTTGSAIGAYR